MTTAPTPRTSRRALLLVALVLALLAPAFTLASGSAAAQGLPEEINVKCGPDEGVVGYWPFLETLPGGIASDGLFVVPTGLINGDVTVDEDGIFQTGANFNRGNINVASDVDFGLADEAITVDVYFKTTDTRGSLIDFRNNKFGTVNNANDGGFLIQMASPTTLLLQLPNNTGNFSWHGLFANLDEPINDGQWHRATITREVNENGRLNSFYVDNELVATSTGGTASVANPDQTIFFGAEIDGGTTFEGTLDEITVYNRALTPEEITDTTCLEPTPPDNDALRATVTCLAGNGRIDVNAINDSDAPVIYELSVGSLALISGTAEPKTLWRRPRTGRPDGELRVRLTENGATILDETVVVACDANQAVSSPEVDVMTWCIGNRGMVWAQMANPVNPPRSYVVQVGKLRRSTTAGPWGAAVRGISGRANGSHDVIVEANGNVIHTETVEVDCS